MFLCALQKNILIEKTTGALNKIFEAWLLTYLRAVDRRVGLLIDFNVVRL